MVNIKTNGHLSAYDVDVKAARTNVVDGDGDNINDLVLYSETDDVLNGGTLDTGVLDVSNVSVLSIDIKLSTGGTRVTTFSTDLAQTTGVVAANSLVNAPLDIVMITPINKYVRIVVTNDSGSTATDSYIHVSKHVSATPSASVARLDSQPQTFTPALLTRSVVFGKDKDGTFQTALVNTGQALVTSEFGTEVALGHVLNHEIYTKFGRNPDVDTGSTPEDIWNGGGAYTGFDATANENIEVFSASAADTGSLLSSGTATGGTATTLTDTGATFVTDGVAVGDILINDTQGLHGTITAVTETQITIFRLNDGAGTDYVNASGDSYRVATSNGTGAGVLRLWTLLDEDFVEQTPAYVILNGVTGVTLTGNYMRCSTARVVLAGSGGVNAGIITVRQATTTANVFAQIPTFGRTTIAATTVPAGKQMVIKSILGAITISTGSSGSGTMIVNCREFGGAWNAVRVYEIQTGSNVMDRFAGGIILNAGSDVKISITDVTANNTIASGEIEYFLIAE